MKRMVLSQDVISAFITQQRQDEKSKATLEKYNRDILAFYSFLPEDKRVDKEKVIDYKTHLIEADYAVASINSMLVAVNSILAYMGAYECRVRLIKQQRQSFCDKKKELTREEYFNLVETAQKRGNMQLALILQTICATGIRVSELQYITVQALRRQEAQVSCKGKIRRILIPKALCIRLSKYCKERSICKGSVFVSRNGCPTNRSSIWAAMKRLCVYAKVAAEKVFPHNLQHLFARIFYKQHKDIVRLADVLGHSNVNTTRIYTLTSGNEQLSQLARMQLLI